MLLATLLVGVAACVQGTIGFGLALTSAAALVLIDPAFVPGPLLASSLPVAALALRRDRDDLDLRGVLWAFVGRVPGTAAGAAAVARMSLASLHVLVSLFVLAAVAVSLRAPRFEPTRTALVGAGVISGITGTIAAIGGPPIALVYQHASGPRLRATISLYFIGGSLLSIAALAAAGAFGRHELELTAVLLPGACAGFFASGPLLRHVDGGRLRPVVLAGAAISAVVLLAMAIS
jgi:uncharacterized protein